MTGAQAALQKLLKGAERANASGGKMRDIVFSQASTPWYYERMTAARLDELHAELLAAERAGVVELVWDRRAGDRGQLKRMVLKDGDGLARHLGVIPRWELLDTAEKKLAPWADRPQVTELLQCWRSGKTPRNREPAQVDQFVEALQVVDRLAALPGGVDRSLRRFSNQVFGDSKRIDDLAVALDLLSRAPDDPLRQDSEIFADFGLMIHPQPFLIAGIDLQVVLSGASVHRVLVPYLGIAPQTVQAVSGGARYVLSVENLDIFHELALGGAGPIHGILLYTAGMPSPAWRAAYSRVLEGIAKETPVYHWGDTDIGGVRILEKLYQTAQQVGTTVRPWLMGMSVPMHHKAVSEAEAAQLVKLATVRGWDDIRKYFEGSALTFEQQAQPLILPEV